MKILFVGDIFGTIGLECLANTLPLLVKENKIDFVIVNGENSTHGSGMNLKCYEEIVNAGANAITSGNHFFHMNYTNAYFAKTPLFVRPYNIDRSASGSGSKVFEVNGIKIRVTNLIGNAYMKDYEQSNIYDAMDELLTKSEEKIHIVDLHAEASGEKVAFAYNYDGKVSAILGTHTHIQTADECILPKKTAYISDVGMTGPYRSCIGSKIKPTIQKLRTFSHTHPDESKNPGIFCGVIIDINEETGLANKIERIRILPDIEGEDYERL